MSKVTKLRIIGAVCLLFILWIIGTYRIEGLPVLIMVFGFAAGYEYIVVRPARLQNSATSSPKRK